MDYVLITGATSGIGLSLARVFARKGYGLVLLSSDMQHLRRARKSLKKRFDNVDIILICEDLSNDGSADRIYNQVKAIGIDIEILVNNAGVGTAGCFVDIDNEADSRMIEVNVVALTNLCRVFMKDMYKKGHGSVLNVASTGAFQPGPYVASYFASKSYVYNFSRAIRVEAARHGVNVSVLCPGTTRTGFFKKSGIKMPPLAMSPGRVAECAVDGMEKNKAVIVPGKLNRFLRTIPSAIKLHGVAILKRK